MKVSRLAHIIDYFCRPFLDSLTSPFEYRNSPNEILPRTPFFLIDLEEIGSLDQSKWFTRGWTLQELIAPRHLLLFDMHWRLLGTKNEHAAAIERITGVLRDVILGNLYPGYCNAAQRISWASKRETTRKEDMAYCLMGLFDIHMLPMYGEGSENAFLRLQQEILKRTSDQTLFLWTASHEPYNQGLLATSPSAFCTHYECFSWLPSYLTMYDGFWSPYASLIPSNHTPSSLQYNKQTASYLFFTVTTTVKVHINSTIHFHKRT
ncbi:hypothetical protein BPOR_0733g00040 [Botrytis porri]|uniref:DUF8212 domain-containing protein n=1 Tax=Botrytis porri TaxID=87229 RepID=A0A4Z1KC61_9HELO|nr:hypothetical protein BPOR_0733g00040 [Botrytis porri]